MAILRLDDPESARTWCRRIRAGGRTLGFVPTMGALHEGHLGLVRRAVRENDRACVSIFVNPLQFDDPDDLAAYPRDHRGDARLLGEVGCAMVFGGTLEQFFPERREGEEMALLDPGPAGRGLEGAHRPGHFSGVATIVARLFEIVEPERAYFGEKDFQQSLVVRDLARARGGPRIVLCATAREPDGLAHSSRNRRLLGGDRERALALSRALFAARSAWRGGERVAERLEGILRAELEKEPIEVDYAALRDPERWTPGPPSGELRRARALVAARVGPVRLIDTLRLDDGGPDGPA